MTQSIPAVSIGMPVYNGERFLRPALDALLGQSFTDFELLIADNASTDATESICREYAARDSRIRYVRHSANRGVVANFQYTLDNTKAKYFMWAACDDWWDKDFVATLADLLDRNSQCAIAFSMIHHLDLSGAVFRDYPHLLELDPRRRARSSVSRWVSTSFDAFMLQNFIEGKVNIIYGLIRRETLVKAEVWHRWGHYSWGQDLLSVAHVLRFGDVVFSERLLWKKTERPDSACALPLPKVGFSPLRSLLNVVRTYAQYLRYCRALWVLQGPLPGVLAVRLPKRIFLTGMALSNISANFVSGAARGLLRRVVRIRQGATT